MRNSLANGRERSRWAISSCRRSCNDTAIRARPPFAQVYVDVEVERRNFRGMMHLCEDPALEESSRETSESRGETELQLPDWLLNAEAGVTPRGAATVRGRVSSGSTRAVRLLLLSRASSACSERRNGAVRSLSILDRIDKGRDGAMNFKFFR